MYGSSSDTSASQVLFLVGDRLAGVGAPADVIVRFSQFVADLRAGRHDPPAALPRLLAGQGIGRYEVDYLNEELRRRGRDEVVEQVPEHAGGGALAGRHDVHKERPRNVLVADLRQVADDRYQASLRVDGENELLLDHTTGQHLQGMLIMEAARQMAIATAERHRAGASISGRYQWAADSWHTEFRRFLFPLPVLLECHIADSDVSSRIRLRFRMDISFIQAGSTAVTSSAGFTAYEQSFISQVERMQAHHAVGRLTGTVGPGQAAGRR